MRAARILVGEEYLACYYPDRHRTFDLTRMDEMTWNHFESTAARVRVIERDVHSHSAYLCRVLTPQTGEEVGDPRSFRSSQILARWSDWARAFLDHHQVREDAEHDRLLGRARTKLADAERAASEWRRRTLDDSRLQLVDARAALYASGVFMADRDLLPPSVTDEIVRRYIDLQHPNGCPYDADIAEASERLSALEDS